MQRKSSSDTEMIKEIFKENGWIGQNLLRENQNFLRIKSLSSILNFVERFQNRCLVKEQKWR